MSNRSIERAAGNDVARFVAEHCQTTLLSDGTDTFRSLETTRHIASHPPRKAESATKSAPASLRDLKAHERALILNALTKTRGKIYGPDGAAALLGLKRTTLSSKVHRMGLKKVVA